MWDNSNKLSSSPEIMEERRKHLSSTLKVFYPSNPLHIVSAKNQYMYDESGRRYLDCINNVAHVGHCHPRVVRAGAEQMSMLNTNTRFLHQNLVDYARRLTATMPEPLSVCFFVCSGSEANDLAIRLARAHTGNKQVISVEGAYHGTTTICQEISSYSKYQSDHNVYSLRVAIPDTYRGAYRNLETAGREYAREIEEKARQNQVAAFICESALSCAGQVILPRGYLSQVYRHVRQEGGVCIADEVQTGFGRMGTDFWGFQTQGVTPDIVTMAKAIGNGFPMAAVITTPEIEASVVKTGLQYFNTCGGNPVSCAVGRAVLDVIEEEGLQENALRVGGYLLEKLRQLQARYSQIGDVRGQGLFIGIELVKNPHTLEPAPEIAREVSEKLREWGVLISIDGPLDNVLKIKPPMCFKREDADLLVETLARAFGSLDSRKSFMTPLSFVNQSEILALSSEIREVWVTPNAIITPSARDAAEHAKVEFKVMN